MMKTIIPVAAAALFLTPAALAEESRDTEKEPRWIEEDYQSIRPGDIDEEFTPRQDGPAIKFDYDDRRERIDEYGLDRLGAPHDRLGTPD